MADVDKKRDKNKCKKCTQTKIVEEKNIINYWLFLSIKFAEKIVFVSTIKIKRIRFLFPTHKKNDVFFLNFVELTLVVDIGDSNEKENQN